MSEILKPFYDRINALINEPDNYSNEAHSTHLLLNALYKACEAEQLDKVLLKYLFITRLDYGPYQIEWFKEPFYFEVEIPSIGPKFFLLDYKDGYWEEGDEPNTNDLVSILVEYMQQCEVD